MKDSFLEKNILRHSVIGILTHSPFIFEKTDYKPVCSWKHQEFSLSSWVSNCNFVFSQSVVELKSLPSADYPVCVPAAVTWHIHGLRVSEKAGPQSPGCAHAQEESGGAPGS